MWNLKLHKERCCYLTFFSKRLWVRDCLLQTLRSAPFNIIDHFIQFTEVKLICSYIFQFLLCSANNYVYNTRLLRPPNFLNFSLWASRCSKFCGFWLGHGKSAPKKGNLSKKVYQKMQFLLYICRKKISWNHRVH